ncbi:MAG TPA: CsgG/HfaB family protein, partial [Phycisphaerae bacterium]|nr:CsgG/HfaB family protein [Phycisphaerae bacterium]
MRTCVRFLALGLAAVLAGCNGALGLGSTNAYAKPAVAVVSFENRAPFPLGWNLGDGTRDILVDRLVATGRYHVVERAELAAVARELQLQHSGATRPQRRTPKGRLKNVQYLIRGVVTDFGHVARDTGFLGLGGLDVFGGSSRAVMGITVQVIEVESGEIICSRSIQKSVRAQDVNVRAGYKDVAIGGSTFYRTPLGKATSKVMDQAVREITWSIASQPWVPKIARVYDSGTVLINGGQDRKVKAGADYEIIEAG